MGGCAESRSIYTRRQTLSCLQNQTINLQDAQMILPNQKCSNQPKNVSSSKICESQSLKIIKRHKSESVMFRSSFKASNSQQNQNNVALIQEIQGYNSKQNNLKIVNLEQGIQEFQTFSQEMVIDASCKLIKK